MNAPIANALVINVFATNADGIGEAMKAYRKSVSEKITTLSELFRIGRQHADFQIEPAELKSHQVGNGTGYYDPLASATFLDAEGEPVPNGSSISAIDEATNRRLAIFVIRTGQNVIIHDRYSVAPGNKVILVMTSNRSINHIVGMEPAWSEGCVYDMVNCCKLFGMEFDRRDNNVYVPFSKTTNLFQAIDIVIVRPQVEDVHEAHIAATMNA
jgi:hypothetical protein